MAANPYASSLGDRDPIVSLAETPERLRAAVERLRQSDFDRNLAPGKWTVSQILVHLAQTELAFALRVRMALTTPRYVVQPLDQDDWMAREAHSDGRAAFQAYYALRLWSLDLYRGLSAADRATPSFHPEHGERTVEWLLALLAGHERHHTAQIEQIGETAGR